MVNVFDKLKIPDTPNLFFWDDLMDDKYPMQVVVVYEDVVYEGMVHFLRVIQILHIWYWFHT